MNIKKDRKTKIKIFDLSLYMKNKDKNNIVPEINKLSVFKISVMLLYDCYE
jgi:hypothetical protein